MLTGDKTEPCILDRFHLADFDALRWITVDHWKEFYFHFEDLIFDALLIHVFFYLQLFDLALLKTYGMKILPLVFAICIELIDALLFQDLPVTFILLFDVVRLDFLSCILGLVFLFCQNF